MFKVGDKVRHRLFDEIGTIILFPNTTGFKPPHECYVDEFGWCNVEELMRFHKVIICPEYLISQ